MHHDALQSAGDIAASIGAVGTYVFIAIYASRPWRSTRAGRALMYRTVALAALLSLNVAAIWLGTDYWGRLTFRLVVYVGLAWTIWYLTFVLWRSRAEERV